jgi:hypothetical protein
VADTVYSTPEGTIYQKAVLYEALVKADTTYVHPYRQYVPTTQTLGTVTLRYAARDVGKAPSEKSTT